MLYEGSIWIGYGLFLPGGFQRGPDDDGVDFQKVIFKTLYISSSSKLFFLKRSKNISIIVYINSSLGT